MARDGHFWATVKLNGVERRMLIDSGATVTAISEQTARDAGVRSDKVVMPIIIRTANGAVTARQATVETLRVGNARASDVAVVVSPSLGEMDVLGMNFLSRLKGWRVEGRTLILEPHHPQATAA
jgi:aspartyl protease family protein